MIAYVLNDTVSIGLTSICLHTSVVRVNKYTWTVVDIYDTEAYIHLRLPASALSPEQT